MGIPKVLGHKRNAENTVLGGFMLHSSAMQAQ